jgi:hypothetical protein
LDIVTRGRRGWLERAVSELKMGAQIVDDNMNVHDCTPALLVMSELIHSLQRTLLCAAFGPCIGLHDTRAWASSASPSYLLVKREQELINIGLRLLIA